LAVVVVDQHLKVLHLLLPAVMVVADLQLSDGQDRPLPKHQQWKHYTSLEVEVVAAETITALEAVQVVMFTTQQCR
jgi:hypothetical protein